MRPRVLLALRSSHDEIVDVVTRFAGEAGWVLERAPGIYPRGVTPGGPLDWCGDGLILDYFQWDELRAIRNVRKLPIVCRADLQGPNVRQVYPDPSVGGRKVFDYFQAKGYRHFAAYDLDYYRPVDTVAAFEDCVRSAGLDLHVLKPYQSMANPDYQTVLQAVSRWVRQLPKPCALFTGEFAHAVVILRACEMAGVPIPLEIALVSNAEHTLACENTRPALSTLAGEHHNMALTMCRLLDAMLRGKSPPRRPVLVTPSGVIERQSSDLMAIPHSATAEAVRYIQTHYADRIGVRQLARLAGVSERSLLRLFLQYLSMRPRDFIFRVRTEEVRKLLENTKDSLSKIARQTGYGSGQALHLAFKNAYGITPGRHRRDTRRVSKTG